MLAPSRVKWRKQQKGKMRGTAKGGTEVSFGEFGLQALSCGHEAAGHGLQAELAEVDRGPTLGNPAHLALLLFAPLDSIGC